MSQTPTINCKYFTKAGNCSHIERGRGFLLLGRPCIMIAVPFAKGCKKKVSHRKPKPPPVPPVLPGNGGE